jgi:ATP-dependent DNA helicase RecQ
MAAPPTSLDAALAAAFGHGGFRPGQREAAEALYAGRDVVAVMPTGAGKSLCYQLPALLLDGVTLVVSPLIALMKDQVDALAAKGLAAAALHSGQGPAERAAAERALEGGALRLLYVAPERLAAPGFLARLAALRVVRLVVDEAHCISSWGHDFRPDYLRLGPLRAQLGVPAGAFTATATPDVRADIARQLALDDPLEVVTGFERPNLSLAVVPVRTRAEKHRELARVVRAAGTPGIVYAATRKAVEEWAHALGALGLTAGAYHGGVADPERVRVQDAFLAGELDAIAATNAFGMGVDKPDIRFVVHADIPGSVEAYYQEAGRAGRDGKPSRCELLFSPADIRTQEFFLEGSNPDEATLRRTCGLLAGCESDEDFESLGTRAGRTAAESMAAATAVRLLRQAAEARGVAPGTGPLPLDLDARAEKARRDRMRLDAIVRYAFHRACRTRYIYDYFAGAAKGGVAPRCGACDICSGERAAPTRPISDAEYERVRIALSAVARLDGRFGGEVIALVLAGSSERKVVDRGLDTLPTHGRLAALPLPAIRELLDVLVAAGLVERRAIAGARAGAAVLGLSPDGALVMRGEARPELPFPAPRLPAEPPPPRTRRRGAPREAAHALPGATAEPPDPDLLARLREWRRRRAAAARTPAYTVFHDSVLEELARRRPASLESLARIKGVGPAKLDRYGAELLGLIADR